MDTDLIVHLSFDDAEMLASVGKEERQVMLETIASEQAFEISEKLLSRSRRRNGSLKGDIIA